MKEIITCWHVWLNKPYDHSLFSKLVLILRTFKILKNLWNYYHLDLMCTIYTECLSKDIYWLFFDRKINILVGLIFNFNVNGLGNFSAYLINYCQYESHELWCYMNVILVKMTWIPPVHFKFSWSNLLTLFKVWDKNY